MEHFGVNIRLGNTVNDQKLNYQKAKKYHRRQQVPLVQQIMVYSCVTLLFTCLTVLSVFSFRTFSNNASLFSAVTDSSAKKFRLENMPTIDGSDVSAKQLYSLVNFVANRIIRKNNIRVANPDQLAYEIVKESLIADEDPLFVASVILAESTFRTRAESHVGALGLMQIMPATGAYIAKKINYDYQGNESLTDPVTNLRLGISYISYLKKKFHDDTHRVLVAYNWGPGNVATKTRYPTSCIEYSNKIRRNYRRWQSDYKATEQRYAYMNLSDSLS